jgi:hypothetical protein
VTQLLVLGAIGAPVLTSCGGSEAHGIAPASDAALGADAAASYISSPVAGEHMGEDGIVKGTVQDYNYNKTGKVYTLIFDAPVGTRSKNLEILEIPTTFKVAIAGDDAENFPSNFAAGCLKHTVCASGTIVDYKGDPAIEAHDPSQLKIDC